MMFVKNSVAKLFKLLLGRKQILTSIELDNSINKILVIRQHNQFGDLLASVSLFRALKETYPESNLTVITSPENYYAIDKNKFIDRNFIFDKKQLRKPGYCNKLMKLLREEYDVCIVPVTVAISKTSCLLAGLSKSKVKIGPASLDGIENKYAFLFDKSVKMNWKNSPERHVSDYGQDILSPLGIRTENLHSEVSLDNDDLHSAELFLKSAFKNNLKRPLIGLHVGAGKIPNRWSAKKFALLMKRLSSKYRASFFLTGTNSDMPSIEELINDYGQPVPVFLNRRVSEVTALISKADLFITNDTGIMHAAGSTEIPLISIFGPTEPKNWAPVGSNKYWVKNTEDIESVNVEEIIELTDNILKNHSA